MHSLSDSQPQGTRALRVLVVDDHHLFRTGLRRLLTEHGFEVVGEAPDGDAALDLVEARRPEVVVVDLHMPRVSGVEVVRAVVERHPSIHLLALTVSFSENDIVDAVEAGAVGYLLKDADPAEIVRAVEAAGQGESVLSPPVAARIVSRARLGEQREAVERVRKVLTERELDVLALLAQGKDNAEIAETLVISRATVKDHVSAILLKLGVSNRVQATVAAARAGLV